MGRTKTISDDQVLRVARDTFRRKGHDATTREIAKAAKIAEPILYQRFGSKDELFFRSMHVTAPDIEELLGTDESPRNAEAYLLAIVERLAAFYREVIPLALRVMMHPSFDRQHLPLIQPGGPATLRQALASRIDSLRKQGKLQTRSPSIAAKLLIGIAHDWALGRTLSHDASTNSNDLAELVNQAWSGLALSNTHSGSDLS